MVLPKIPYLSFRISAATYVGLRLYRTQSLYCDPSSEQPFWSLDHQHLYSSPKMRKLRVQDSPWFNRNEENESYEENKASFTHVAIEQLNEPKPNDRKALEATSCGCRVKIDLQWLFSCNKKQMNVWWPFGDLVDSICQIITQATQGLNDGNIVKTHCY